MPEDAERARSLAIVRVDVVHVRDDAVGGESVQVVREVQRAPAVDRRDTAPVLRRDHEHAPVRVASHGVRERVAGGAAALEPHLHGVAGGGAGDEATHDPVVDVAAGPVPGACVGLGRRRRLDRAPVHLVADGHGSEAPLDQHLHRLRIAVGDAEAKIAQRVPALLRIETRRLEIERLHGRPEVRLGIGRVGRRTRERERERQVLLELRLHKPLVVRKDEAAPVTALAELGRPAEGSRLGVGVVVGRAVRRVEVGAHTRVVALDRRTRVGARVGHEERVVERRRLHLPAERVEQERPVGVVGEEELEAEAVDQPLVRLRLRLRGAAGTAIGEARELARGPLVVVVPALVVVAV